MELEKRYDKDKKCTEKLFRKSLNKKDALSMLITI